LTFGAGTCHGASALRTATQASDLPAACTNSQGLGAATEWRRTVGVGGAVLRGPAAVRKASMEW